MRLSSAAIGLAAVGAGLLVARMVMPRRESNPPPPSPEQLIGQPQMRLSAVETADTFRRRPPDMA